MSDMMSSLLMAGLERVNPTTSMLTVGTGLLSYCWWSLRRPYKAPPGPTHIPMVGNTIMSGSRDMKVFAELPKKYGKIYSIYMGHK